MLLEEKILLRNKLMRWRNNEKQKEAVVYSYLFKYYCPIVNYSIPTVSSQAYVLEERKKYECF